MKKSYWLIILGVFICLGIAVFMNGLGKDEVSGKQIDQEERIRELENFVEKDPEDIKAKKSLAWEYLINGQFKDAISLNEQVLEVKKNDTEAMHQLVVSYISIKEYEKAKSISEELLKFNHYNPVALTNHAQIYFLLENEDEFVTYIHEAIEAASIQELEGEQKEFYDILNEVITQFTSHIENGELDSAYMLLSSQDYLESRLRVKALDKILTENPSSPASVYTKKGILEMEMNELEDAKNTYQKLLEYLPNEDYGAILLADILYKLGDYKSLELQKEKIQNKQIQEYINSLSTFQTDKEKGFHQLEKVYNEISNEYKQVLLNNLFTMSKEIKDENLINKYEKLYAEAEYDLDYSFAIMLNPRLNPYK